MASNPLAQPKDIPDLSGLAAQAAWMYMLRGLGGGGSPDHVAYTLQLNCVRLGDAAIGDYEFGRRAIELFYARRPEDLPLGYIIQATTRFESCIWHLERFIKHARALRSLQSAEIDLKASIPKNTSFFQQSAEKQITRFRHTLAPLEGKAQKGELPQGKSIALDARSDGLWISDQIIKWHDLARWLSEAHSCVERLASYRPCRS